MPHKSIKTIWSGLRATQGRIFLSPRHCGGTMQNDSIETLLLRHYGSMAQAPVQLEEHLRTSVRSKAAEMRKRERNAAYLTQRRFSRRQVIRLVVGLGTLSVGVESLRMLESALPVQKAAQPAYS